MTIGLLSDPRPLLDLPEPTLLAVDTEFHAERRYTPTLHLVQVRAQGHQPWLIDPTDDEVWRAVAPVLPRHPWLVHAGSQDLVLLQRALGRVPDRVLDTQIAAGLVQTHYPAGLQRLLEHFLGLQVDKSASLSDWSRRPLSATQLRYAAGDVAHLHDLWQAVLDERPDRQDVILAACEEARTIALSPPEDPSQRIPGRTSLAPEQAAVLRALATWREQEARALDQPAYSVLGNGTLLALSKRMPTDLDTLTAGRRSPKKVLRRHSEPILATIAAARATDPSGWPLPIRQGSPRAARYAWLNAWAEQTAQANQWSKRLVTPEPLLERWIDAFEVDGWRAALLEPVRGTLDAPLACPPVG